MEGKTEPVTERQEEMQAEGRAEGRPWRMDSEGRRRMDAEWRRRLQAEWRRRMEAEMEMKAEMAEVAKLKRLAELEMVAQKKKKSLHEEAIFWAWWNAWDQAQKQEEDHEWVSTDWWNACDQDHEQEEDHEWDEWVSKTPLMAEWKPWEPDEDLLVDLYETVVVQKANELFLNIWKKVGFGEKVFQQELEDVELMTYCRNYANFRKCWEDRYCDQHGQFQDISPRPRTLQVFSVKIVGSNWPLQVYGLIAICDFVDPQRNMIFNRHRDECQIITQEDPYLPLTGPTRPVVMGMTEIMGPVTIEAELKVKGAVESEDKYIILDAIGLPTLVGSGLFGLAGPQMKLEISLGAIQKCVEATIFIRVVDGTWPTCFHGQFVANTASMDCNKVILLEFSGDGEMKQSRYVMSVEASGILVVTLKASKGKKVRSVIFNAVNRGRSIQTLRLDSCHVQVLVAWSLISPYCNELAPHEFMELCNF